MDIITFFGRFHPLIVHLPIGTLLAAILIAFLSRKKKYSFLAPALDFVLLLGAISAALACVLGYMLSWAGDYNPDGLFWHKWGGILLAVLSFAVYWIRTRWKKKPVFLVRYSHFLFLGLLALLFFTGHKGGNLTHGSDYLLRHAPDPLRLVAGLGPKPVPRPPVTDLAAADIFLDVIHPIVRVKCQSCHNPDKVKGGLLLGNYEEMLKGGESGPAIVPGSPEESEFYRRITLPKDHEEFMPAEGKPGLNEDQLALVKWWIEKGAPSSGLLADMEADSRTSDRLARVLGLNISESRLPGLQAAPADAAALQQAREQGFIIKRIAPESNFLEVQLPFTGVGLEEIPIKSLLPIKEQIAWIDLSDGNVQDGDLAVIGQLSSLSRLDLSGNPISDTGLSSLSGLKELTYLNLYGTSVSDDGLALLKGLEKLRSLYLWQTAVTGGGVESFRSERPDITVTMGYL